jgi:hypothetical protein
MLHLVGSDSSTIAPETFEAQVIQALVTGTSAWDPYD